MTFAQPDPVEQESQEHSTTRIKYRNGNTSSQNGKKNDNTSVGHQTYPTQIRLTKYVAMSQQHGSSNKLKLLQLKVKQINGKHNSQSHPVAQNYKKHTTKRINYLTQRKMVHGR
jgi:hypothetical protein